MTTRPIGSQYIGTLVETIAQALHLPPSRVLTEEARDKRIFGMWLACHTQQEIADAEGVSVQVVKDAVSDDTADLPNNLKAAADHATEFEPPLYNIWKQQDKTPGGGHFGNSEVRIEARRRACAEHQRARRHGMTARHRRRLYLFCARPQDQEETMTTTYGTQHELRHSQDDFLACTECDMPIDPGDPLVYLVGAKEGFLFYHPGCIDVNALRDR